MCDPWRDRQHGLLRRFGRWVPAWLLFGCSLAGATPLTLDATFETRGIREALDYLGSVSVTEETARAVATDMASGGYPTRPRYLPERDSSDHWFRLTLHNTEARDRELVLALSATNMRLFEWYVFEGATLLTSNRVAFGQPFAERPVPDPEVVAPLSLRRGQSVTVMLRVQGRIRLAADSLELWEAGAWYQHRARATRYVWFFGGVLAVMALYNLFIALITRDRSYVLYVAWVVATLLMYAAQQGYGFMYLWPEATWWSQRAIVTLTLVMLTLFGLFSMEFLLTRHRQPWVHRALQGLSGLLGVMAVVYCVQGQPMLPAIMLVALPASLILVLTAWLASFRQWLTGKNTARNYFVAWSPFVLYVVWDSLERLWTQEYFDPMSDTAIYMMGLSIALLSIALADRIRILREASQRASVESRAKSDFLAKMSHEIRTPLNGMLGMASLLRETRLDKTQRHYSDVIYSSGTALLTVINDILDYSKIEAGKMQLESIPFDLEKLALDTTAIFKVQADEKGLDLIFDQDPALPKRFRGDPNRLRQVLVNLLSNALKFTEKGEVVVRLCQADDAGLVRLEVRDTGTGIPQEKQAHLFDFFTQADSSTSRKYGGSGLGLAICRELVTLMGGEIGVRSRPFEGSTFWVTFRLTPVSDREETPVRTVSLMGKRLLVVDDNITFCQLVQRQCELWGMRVTSAQTGEQALRLLKESVKVGTPFDLVSIDLHMPVMDGLVLAETMQESTELREIPRLLLTSATELPSRAVLKGVGIDVALEKPVSPTGLLEALHRLVSGEDYSEPRRQARQGSLTTASRPLNILVAEDNEVNQLVIKSVLERLGHEVTLVANGALVVEAFVTCMRADSGWSPFDAVLMDCEMPEMDGYQATERIRAWEKEQGRPPTPILALTAHVMPDYLDRCLLSGMNDYLLKPVNMETLQEKLESYAGAASSDDAAASRSAS